MKRRDMVNGKRIRRKAGALGGFCGGQMPAKVIQMGGGEAD